MSDDCIEILRRNIAKLKSGNCAFQDWKEMCQNDFDSHRMQYADLLEVIRLYGNPPDEAIPFVEGMKCEMLFNKNILLGDKEKAAVVLRRYKTITNSALEGMMSMETGSISVDLMQEADVAETVVKEGAIHSCGVIWMLRREQYECLLQLL